MNSHCFKHRRFYSVSINLLNIAKFSGVESKSTVPEFRKRERKFLCCVHQLHERVREIKKFHVTRKRGCCCFANINLSCIFYFIYLLRSRYCFLRPCLSSFSSDMELLNFTRPPVQTLVCSMRGRLATKTPKSRSVTTDSRTLPLMLYDDSIGFSFLDIL